MHAIGTIFVPTASRLNEPVYRKCPHCGTPISIFKQEFRFGEKYGITCFACGEKVMLKQK